MDDPPLLVYDDDCGFCTWSARWAARHSDVRPIGFSELSDDLRARLPADYKRCAHLLADGETYSCGASVERTLGRVHPALGRAFAVLRRVPGYARLRERLYRWAADHRAWWGRVVSAEAARDGA
ncbi:thiol-disulfide oxidoreductase DCC family protein [Halomarina pelagica]|uniref:thiol-disulfide oxidoreductase DCC family protein n=1 Tax=Halomarina pelagica TaxID=2961599 RepID=UPI0020C4345A|nr:DCC1-like thiol-disulfide oxidoreductase family protein [Halomarina sp. BND7]